MLTLDPAAAALNGRVGRKLNGGAAARVMVEEMTADHLHVFRIQVDRDGRCRMNMVERLPDEGERPLRLEAYLFLAELVRSLRRDGRSHPTAVRSPRQATGDRRPARGGQNRGRGGPLMLAGCRLPAVACRLSPEPSI